MSKPVKTLFMEAVEVDLIAITTIKEVKRGQDIPIDFDTVACPFAAFFTEVVSKTPANRVQTDEFNLIIHALVRSGTETTEDQCDALDAAIETMLLRDGTALRMVKGITPVSSDVFYPNDTDAILQAVYRIELVHEYGDATNPGN